MSRVVHTLYPIYPPPPKSPLPPKTNTSPSPQFAWSSSSPLDAPPHKQYMQFLPNSRLSGLVGATFGRTWEGACSPCSLLSQAAHFLGCYTTGHFTPHFLLHKKFLILIVARVKWSTPWSSTPGSRTTRPSPAKPRGPILGCTSR